MHHQGGKMLENKMLKLEDNGKIKKFTVNKLGAIQALCLLRSLLSLLADTDLIKSVVMQQFIQEVLRVNQEISTEKREQYQHFMEMDTVSLITYLVRSLFLGLNDINMQEIIAKCLDGVIYDNGDKLRTASDALDENMILDYEVVLVLVAEVLTLNFGGGVERIKKLLAHKLQIESATN